jgi:hypothetical protein
VPSEKVVGAYFYSGNANGRWSLLNQGNTHRWAALFDFDGDTFCVKPTISIPRTFTYNGHTMIRTAVKGTMSDTSLKTACAKLGAGYKPVCDHSHYNDGGCITANNDWHFSYPVSGI